MKKENFVFLDESSAKTTLTPAYGRAPSNQRCYCDLPTNRWHSTTMLSAIRSDGLIQNATLAIEGAMTRNVFEAYLQQMLGPTLNFGDVVVMDNLSAHKGGNVEQIISDFGANVWYLPPYSPELNPIELVWNTAKTWLKKAEARTREDLYDAIGWALNKITPTHCNNYFEHCGYS